MSYRVVVRNPFDLLDDENEDPANRIQPPRTIIEEKEPETKHKKETTPKDPQTKPSATKKPQDDSKRNLKPAVEQKPLKREGDVAATDKGARRPNNNNKDFAREPRNDKFVERLDNRDGRGPRQPRAEGERSDGRPPRGGRVHDRRSGTGRDPTENKRGGSGKGNWGKADEVIDVPAADSTEKTEEKDAAAEGETVSSPKKEVVEEKEAEKEVKDYNEFLAERAQKAPKVESLKLRTVDNTGNPEWAAYTPLAREADHEVPANKKKVEKHKDDKHVTEKAPEENLLNFKFNPVESDRPRGGGGGRGRGGRDARGPRRGGRDEYSGRGNTGGNTGGNKSSGGRGNGFQLDDSSFPTLGGAIKSQ